MYWRRQRDDACLLAARRHVIVATRAGCALVLVTEHIVTIHHFGAGGVKGDPLRTINLFLCQRPDLKDLYDWRSGWHLERLAALIEESMKSSYRQKPRLSPAGHDRRHRRRIFAERARRLARATQPPYAPLFCHSIRALAPLMDDGTFKTLVTLASYANEYGCCFPSRQTLADVTGHSVPEIRDELDTLEEWGLIRYISRQERDKATGLFKPDVFQINPGVLYIRHENRADALGLSKVAFQGENPHSTPLSEEETPLLNFPRILNRNHQGTKTREPRPENQSQEPPPPPKPVSSKSGGLAAPAHEYAKNGHKPARSAAPAERLDSPATPPTAQNGHKPAQSAPTPPHSPPAPPAAAQRRYEEPLPDVALETLAHEVRQLAPTRLWQARQLVSEYDPGDVRAGLLHLAKSQLKGNVREPFGLLKFWLEKRIMSAERAAPDMPAPDGKSYISGELSKFIKS